MDEILTEAQTEIPTPAQKGQEVLPQAALPPVRRGLSIRSKLLGLLIFLPLLTLGIYLALAVSLFQKDKIAYVYESESSRAKTLAAQVGAEIQTYLAEMRPMVTGYEPATGQFTQATRVAFHTQSRLRSLTLLKRAPGTENFIPSAELSQKGRGPRALKLLSQSGSDSGAQQLTENSLFDRAKRLGIALSQVTRDDETLIQFAQYSESETTELIALGEFRSDAFQRAFEKVSGLQSRGTLLIDTEGSAILGAAESLNTSHIKDSALFQAFQGRDFLEGAIESKLPGNQDIGLVALSPVGVGSLYTISWMGKDQALEASQVLIKKSALFLIAILSLGTLVAFFASSKLTGALGQLSQAAEKISQGDFQVNVKTQATDEVGVLAHGFNQMAQEVSRLMIKNVERARMEKELETARTVQETLFPDPVLDTSELSLRAFYEPASECGGDWWHYTQTERYLYFWIGDATGHGVPAALITSAACSAVSLIEKQEGVLPSQAIRSLSGAIRATSKSQMLMSFFAARLDLKEGKLLYANASHNPPFWVKKTSDAPARRDILKLRHAVHPHLGSESEVTYQDAEVELSPGDLLVFYTDGLTELKNAAGELIGERKVVHTILEAIQADFSGEFVLTRLRDAVTTFRDGAPLDDDTTFYVCEYRGPSQA